MWNYHLAVEMYVRYVHGMGYGYAYTGIHWYAIWIKKIMASAPSPFSYVKWIIKGSCHSETKQKSYFFQSTYVSHIFQTTWTKWKPSGKWSFIAGVITWIRGTKHIEISHTPENRTAATNKKINLRFACSYSTLMLTSACSGEKFFKKLRPSLTHFFVQADRVNIVGFLPRH